MATILNKIIPNPGDTGCVKKSWEKMSFIEDSPSFRIVPRFLCHSTNWSCGSLHIDLFSLDIDFWKWNWFFVYRIKVFPPSTKDVTHAQSILLAADGRLGVMDV